MPKLTIDGTEIDVAPGTSVLQACEQLGIEIPRFCFHDRLSVPANCRMCLVEQEKAPKPIASCAVAAADGMVIKTNTEVVHKARRGVMEMLLINHPLDCPICDQGGECDLQDQAVSYGFDRSRYNEAKRAVKDKELGPVVKTVMTRCIHCTRCVRFMDEVAGTGELGLAGRGEDVEIGTYITKSLTSELSGNIVDICPVGALTAKPYAFIARPWELRKTESVDVLDAVGSNIRIDARGGEVLRILPRLNEGINEEWLSDKSRHAHDGLKRQRLDKPYIRENGKLRSASWNEAFSVIAQKLAGLPGSKIAGLVGDLADVESSFLLKQLLIKLGSSHYECRQDGAAYDCSTPAAYRFNSTISGIEQADALLIIGSNPRHEATMVNARIRKAWRNGLKVGLIGEKCDLTYTYQYLGAGPASLKDLGSFAEVLKKAQRPMIILGAGALARPDGAAIHAAARALADEFGLIKEGWNGFNILQTAAARTGGLELGITTPGGLRSILDGAKKGTIEVIYNLGADEIAPNELGTAFVIYQGHHGDHGAMRADVILPGAAYTEKNALYVNTEGRAQLAKQAVFPPGEAKEDWKILRALSEALGQTLPFETHSEIRKALAALSPTFAAPGRIAPATWAPFGDSAGKMLEAPFISRHENYYMTCPISRNSPTMAKCTEEILPLITTTAKAARTGTNA